MTYLTVFNFLKYFYMLHDDAKIFKHINCRFECVLLQRDLNSIANLCTLWQSKLNISKRMFIRFSLVDKSMLTIIFLVL